MNILKALYTVFYLDAKHRYDDTSEISYINYQTKHKVPLRTVLKNIGYIKEEKKMADVQEEVFSVIRNPSHYCEGRKFEPKDVIRDWDLNFNLGNAVKYISRNGRKEGESALKDLKKAKTYLEFEIEALEKGE